MYCYQELHRADSIPFLRRVSAEYQQKSDVVRLLDIPDLPAPDTPRADVFVSGSPPNRRRSNSMNRDYDPISPREHSFVKTTFHKRKSRILIQDRV
jgi:hypothetical protein